MREEEREREKQGGRVRHDGGLGRKIKGQAFIRFLCPALPLLPCLPPDSFHPTLAKDNFSKREKVGHKVWRETEREKESEGRK